MNWFRIIGVIAALWGAGVIVSFLFRPQPTGSGASVAGEYTGFIFGFLSEPSATGRILGVLVTWIALSIVSSLAGAVGAVGLLRREASARPIAWIAAIGMTLTGVGAVVGIPALVGLAWSRNPARP